VYKRPSDAKLDIIYSYFMTIRNMQMSKNVSKQRGRRYQDVCVSNLTMKTNWEIYAFLSFLLDKDE
jgi:hypothetical protein